MTPFSLMLFLGLLGGVLLERTGCFTPTHLLEQLRLRNFRILTTLSTAIMTQLIILLILNLVGVITIHPNFLLPYANLFGGVLIGLGVVAISYVPAKQLSRISPIGIFGGMALLVAFLLGARFGIQGFFAIYPDLPAYYFTNYTLNRPHLGDAFGITFPVAASLMILLLLALILIWRKRC